MEVEHDSWWPGTQTAWRLCDDSPTASPGFTSIATGTTWTSGPRADGFNYYYKVATVNVNWSSAASPSTPRRYIASGNCS